MKRRGDCTPPIERMLRRKVVDEDGCWIWPGSLNGSTPDAGGYGQIVETADNRRLLMVHRVAYDHFIGSIPQGYVVDHACHNGSGCPGGRCKHRRCWNPAHLQAVTFSENCLIGQAPGAVTRRSGVCKRGHLQTDENVSTWVRPSGSVRRQCRLCQNLTRRLKGVTDGNSASK